MVGPGRPAAGGGVCVCAHRGWRSMPDPQAPAPPVPAQAHQTAMPAVARGNQEPAQIMPSRAFRSGQVNCGWVAAFLSTRTLQSPNSWPPAPLAGGQPGTGAGAPASQPRTWWAGPEKAAGRGRLVAVPGWSGPGLAFTGGNANRLEGVRPPLTRVIVHPSSGPSCLTRPPRRDPAGPGQRGLARCVVERLAGVVGQRPSSEGAWRPESGRMGTGSSAGISEKATRVREIGGRRVGKGAVRGGERLWWALAGARRGSLVVFVCVYAGVRKQKVGLSGVGFEPTPPGETAT